MPAHIGIEMNEAADITAKEVTDMPGMVNPDYFLTIWRAIKSKWQMEWETSISKINYIKPCIEEWESSHNSCIQYKVKLSRLCIRCTDIKTSCWEETLFWKNW